jgi:hypothetical protein
MYCYINTRTMCVMSYNVLPFSSVLDHSSSDLAHLGGI